MRDKENFIVTRRASYQEDIAILNLYVSSNIFPIYIKQKQNRRNKSLITVEDINTPVSLVDGKNRQKISKDIKDIINTINI